jgi:AcrR family transcriptional regulator
VAKPERKGRPGGRTERNRKAVADAVLICVKEGRLDFEIQEIAAISGVHRTTISRRWPDRGALMAEAMAEHVGQLSIPLSGDWERDVHAITAGLKKFFANPTELTMNRMLAISDNLTFHEKMSEYWLPVFKAFEEPFRLAKESGLIRENVDPEIIIMMIYSVLTVYSVLNRIPDDTDLTTRLADQIIELCRKDPVTEGHQGAALNGSRPPARATSIVQGVNTEPPAGRRVSRRKA